MVSRRRPQGRSGAGGGGRAASRRLRRAVRAGGRRQLPGAALGGSAGEDQFAALASLLPGYTAVPGIAVDVPAEDGGRRRFGHMILSRLPVRQVFRHLLPYPADHAVPGMPRIAVEAVGRRPVRRRARDHDPPRVLLADEAVGAGRGAADALRRRLRLCGRTGSIGATDGPYETFARPAATIITGDFNLEPDDPLHPRMEAAFADGTPPLADAWVHAHPGVPHPPTMNVYQKVNRGGSAATLRLHLREPGRQGARPRRDGRRRNAGVGPPAGRRLTLALTLA